jgi:hypothetical protein
MAILGARRTMVVTSIFLVVIIFSSFFPNSVKATIIDINARTDITTNPIVMFFATGTYVVNPIGTADGGAYNAWDPWGNGNRW